MDLPAEIRLKIFKEIEEWADFRSLRQVDRATAELTFIYAGKGLDLSRFDRSAFNMAFLEGFMKAMHLPNIVFGRLFQILPVSRIPWTSDHDFVGDYLADEDIVSEEDPRLEGFIALGALGKYTKEKEALERKKVVVDDKGVPQLQAQDYHAILLAHEKWIESCHRRNISDTLGAICRFFADKASLEIIDGQGVYDSPNAVSPLLRIGLGQAGTVPTLTAFIAGLRILSDDLLLLARKLYRGRNDGLSRITRTGYIRAVHCLARTLHDIVFKCLHPSRSLNMSLEFDDPLPHGQDRPYNRFLVNAVTPFAVFLCNMLN
ncbi:hypothetical protein BJ508DRAFT_337024, partial [Ascobolus immersus RN42]